MCLPQVLSLVQRKMVRWTDCACHRYFLCKPQLCAEEEDQSDVGSATGIISARQRFVARKRVRWTDGACHRYFPDPKLCGEEEVNWTSIVKTYFRVVKGV